MKNKDKCIVQFIEHNVNNVDAKSDLDKVKKPVQIILINQILKSNRINNKKIQKYMNKMKSKLILQ